MKARVNILLSTYNGEKYLDKQIHSILKQTYPEIFIYIRDDGSSDGTQKIIEKYQCCDNIILLEDNRNLGFCHSFLELLRLADEGDYWAFCDQDDIWGANKIKHAVEWLDIQESSIPLLYHCSYERIDENDLKIGDVFPPTFVFDFARCLTENIFSGFAMVVNRTTREYMLRFNHKEIKYHDWLAGMLAVALGKFKFDTSIDAYYRIHNSNASPHKIIKKINLFLTQYQEESFFRRRVKEIKRVIYNELKDEQKIEVDSFLNQQFFNRLQYAVSLHQYNSNILSDLAIRILFLTGRI